VSNLLLRLAWALTISPESLGIVMDPVLFTSLLATIEVARRAQWNIFRLENEQLNNTEKYRAVEVAVPLMIVNTHVHDKKVMSIPANKVSPMQNEDTDDLVEDFAVDTPTMPRNRGGWVV
jgi:hypothetical protein